MSDSTLDAVNAVLKAQGLAPHTEESAALFSATVGFFVAEHAIEARDIPGVLLGLQFGTCLALEYPRLGGRLGLMLAAMDSTVHVWRDAFPAALRGLAAALAAAIDAEDDS